MDSLIDKLFFPSNLVETSLMRKFSGSQAFLKGNSLFQNMPPEYQHELLESNMYSSDFDITRMSKAPHSKINLHSLFKTFTHNLLLPNLSPGATLMQEYMRAFSSPVHKIEDMNLDFSNLYLGTSPYRTAMKSKESTESGPKATTKNQVVVSLTECKPLVNKTILTSSVAKKVIRPLNVDKKEVKVNCNLNQQLVIRKTKELQKRSKKRRKRQKKGSSDFNQKTNSENKVAASLAVSSSDLNKRDCDIFCDVTITPDSKSLQIVLPNVSSFVVTLESGEDDDSDWDTATSNADDDSEFQICGLFVTSFSTTQFCGHALSISKPNVPDEDFSSMKAELKKVNKNWNNTMKGVELKEKSPQLVSFAPDEELEEICPVEMFDRKGEWEVYATERLRFKKRIDEMEAILSPCFSTTHRAKIYSNLYQSVL